MELKDKAKAKEERRATRRSEVRIDGQEKGPQIAWDEAVTYTVSPDVPQPPVDPLPEDSAGNEDDPPAPEQ